MSISRHTVFQHGLISSLAAGVFDDDFTVGDLLGHGSFGLGTFNALDGEMIVLDGVSYQMRSDGSVSKASLDQHTPYAVVTDFVPSLHTTITEPMNRAQLTELLDGLLPSDNYLYAVRITGEFNLVTTRTVEKQERPYPLLVEATDGEEVHRFEQVSGTLAGFRTPEFEATISVPGYHLHFIDDSHSKGGHSVEIEVKHAEVEISIATDLEVRLPLSKEYQEANLVPDDYQDQIGKAEHAGH